MQDKNDLSPADKKQLKEAMKRFHEELKKQPEISDEEFMAEFEVSDEQYKIGLVLPGMGNKGKEEE